MSRGALPAQAAVFLPLVTGLSVGAALGLLDSLLSPGVGAGVALGLAAATALWVSLVEAAALSALVAAARPLSRHLPPRALPWILPVLFALLASVPIAWVVLKALAGPSVRDTAAGRFGPWVLIPLGVIGAAVLAFLAAPGRSWRLGRVGIFLALGAAAVAGDRVVLVGLYPFLHAAALSCAVLAFQVALASILQGLGEASLRRLASIAMVLGVGGTVGVLVAGVDAAREAVRQQGSLTGRLVGAWRGVLDFDGDGFSGALGGGDCDDLDEGVGPLVLDVPGNGVDEDCDGRDLDAATARALAAHWSQHPWARVPGGAGLSELRAHTAGRPIILITVEALREDLLEELVPPEAATLARFLKEGVRFSRAYAAASSTRLSLPILQSGAWIPGSASASLAERLRSAGYATALVSYEEPIRFVAEDRLELHPPYDLRAGFDRVALVGEAGVEQDAMGAGATEPQDAATVDVALEVLRGMPGDRPFFVWIHLFDLHQWHVLPGSSSGSPKQRYVAAGRRALGQLDRLLLGIESLPWGREAALLLSADHGEALGERGLLHHTRFLYDAFVHVPLVVRVPGVAAREVDEPVSLLDVAPTVLDLAGGACDGCDGDSLVPLLTGDVRLPDRSMLLRDNDQVAHVAHGRKLLYTPRAGIVELYALGAEEPTQDRALEDGELTRLLLQQLRYSPLRDVPPLLVPP